MPIMSQNSVCIASCYPRRITEEIGQGLPHTPKPNPDPNPNRD